MKKFIVILITAIILSSCGVTDRVVTRQKELMSQHESKIKKPKKDRKKQRQAFTITVFLFLGWYALWQGSNTES
jgi:uncharacterized protein YxeA